MTITNYMPTYDTRLFQNIDIEYIFYFEYDGIIYVFRSNNRLNNNTTTIPENLRLVNVRPENLRITNYYNNNRITNYYNNNNRITNYYNNNNRITNYYNNRNRITNYDYIRNY